MPRKITQRQKDIEGEFLREVGNLQDAYNLCQDEQKRDVIWDLYFHKSLKEEDLDMLGCILDGIKEQNKQCDAFEN